MLLAPITCPPLAVSASRRLTSHPIPIRAPLVLKSNSKSRTRRRLVERK